MPAKPAAKRKRASRKAKPKTKGLEAPDCRLDVSSPDIREVVELSLGLVGGLTVHTCDSGERALEILPQLRPNLILLDVMMPRLDGPSTLQRLRADPELNRIPVVFMTAKAMPQEVERFKQLLA